MAVFEVGTRVRAKSQIRYLGYEANPGELGTVVEPATIGKAGIYPLYVLWDNGDGFGIEDEQIFLVQAVKPEAAPAENRMVFEGGGMREPQDGKPRFDLLFPVGVPYEEQFLTRFAVHMAKGAAKYEDRNWEKFSDKEALERAKASALRHIMQWLSGETDEDHAAAVVFNLMAADHVKRKMENQ